jgi:hypothetical protein
MKKKKKWELQLKKNENSSRQNKEFKEEYPGFVEGVGV